MHNGRTTLNKFIIEEQRKATGATGEFSTLLNDLVTAIKVISMSVGKGPLLGLLGNAGARNVQGEQRKKLDVVSNDILLRYCEWAGHLCDMASEELDDVYQIPYSWFGMLVIFAFGTLLGLLRARTTTTVVILVHALYDVFAGLLSG